MNEPIEKYDDNSPDTMIQNNFLGLEKGHTIEPPTSIIWYESIGDYEMSPTLMKLVPEAKM